MGHSQREFQCESTLSDIRNMTNATDMITTTILTDREIEIIDALSQGLSSDEISVKLFISTFTVNTHRRNAMDKLKARNAAHLVRICFEEGVIGNENVVYV